VTAANEAVLELAPAPDLPGLWWRPASKCRLTNGHVYHYWFEVIEAAQMARGAGSVAPIRRPDRSTGGRCPRCCRRPTAPVTGGRPRGRRLARGQAGGLRPDGHTGQQPNASDHGGILLCGRVAV